jgi:hypothetical protein
MMGIAGFAGAARKLVIDNAPTILTAVAVMGVATTAIMAVKATPRAMKLLEVAEARNEPVLLTPQEKLRLIAPCYIPASVVGIMTMACIVGVNSVHMKRQAALISAYTLVENKFQNYQAKVIEKLGENKEKQVRDEVAQDQVNQNPVSSKEIIMTGNGDVLFMDTLTNRYFKSTYEKVKRAENELNHKLNHEMYASLNDFYEMLEIPHNDLGEELGWKSGNLLDVYVSGTISEDKQPCLAISFSSKPIREYYKLN